MRMRWAILGLLVLGGAGLGWAAQGAAARPHVSTTVVINEVYAPNLTYSNQYFELYNKSATAIDLSSYYIYNSGGYDRLNTIPPSPLIQPGQHLAIGATAFPSSTIGSGLQPGGDFLALVQSNGTQDTTIDVVNWGQVNPNWSNYPRFQQYFWIGNAPAMPTSTNLSLQRWADGYDTDQPTDWIAEPASPGQPPAPTPVPAGTARPSPTPVSTAVTCAGYRDVPPGAYFAGPVAYLTAHGILAGYADCTFRPYAPLSRAELVKAIRLSFGLPGPVPTFGIGHTFADVPVSHPFYGYIEDAAQVGLVSGYPCGPGGPGPCDSEGRPYFLPDNPATRGQVAKLLVGAAGLSPAAGGPPTFADVPRGAPFAAVIEAAVCHGVLSGYGCGAAGEPCSRTEIRRYFRPGVPITRGQVAKSLYLTLTTPAAPCRAPTRAAAP